MPDSSTPTPTPSARLCVPTTVITVASITRLERRGCLRKSFSELQLNVPIDTMIMMATSAGIGISPTMSPSTTSRNSRNAPAVKVDSRPRPPERTLITDWPIMAQPAMPPKKPVMKLAMPCPIDSRFLSLSVSVIWSTIEAVSRLSSRPTAATPIE